jgi:hypothetical protein
LEIYSVEHQLEKDQTGSQGRVVKQGVQGKLWIFPEFGLHRNQRVGITAEKNLTL